MPPKFDPNETKYSTYTVLMVCVIVVGLFWLFCFFDEQLGNKGRLQLVHACLCHLDSRLWIPACKEWLLMQLSLRLVAAAVSCVLFVPSFVSRHRIRPCCLA